MRVSHLFFIPHLIWIGKGKCGKFVWKALFGQFQPQVVVICKAERNLECELEPQEKVVLFIHQICSM